MPEINHIHTPYDDKVLHNEMKELRMDAGDPITCLKYVTYTHATTSIITTVVLHYHSTSRSWRPYQQPGDFALDDAACTARWPQNKIGGYRSRSTRRRTHIVVAVGFLATLSFPHVSDFNGSHRGRRTDDH